MSKVDLALDTQSRRPPAIPIDPPQANAHAAGLPVLECLVSERLFDDGVGFVALIRGASPAHRHIAFFAVDSFCRGVKDAIFYTADWREADRLLDAMQLSGPASPVAPAEARKLLRDLVAWAADNGFPPHADYVRLEPLFGDVKPAETDYTSRFGRDGDVLYVPGPGETPAQVRRRMQRVRSRLGDAVAERSLFALAGVLAERFELVLDDEQY